MENILRSLVAIPSPSGFENRVIKYLKELLEDHVDELKVDGLGNLIVMKKGACGLLFCTCQLYRVSETQRYFPCGSSRCFEHDGAGGWKIVF